MPAKGSHREVGPKSMGCGVGVDLTSEPQALTCEVMSNALSVSGDSGR